MSEALTPHGPGFRFLDSVDDLEPGVRAVGLKWLDPAALYFADHFPGQPIMPGVLLIEAAAQLAGVVWQARAEGEPRPLMLAAVQQFRLLAPVLPGATLRIVVTLEKNFGALAQFKAEISVEGAPVAAGVLTLSTERSAEHR